MQLYANNITEDILRDQINTLASGNGHAFVCEQTNRDELWECQDRKATFETAKYMLWNGAKLVADRNGDGSLTKSEFKDAETFIDNEYLNLIGGCLSFKAQSKTLSASERKTAQDERIECIATWSDERVAKPVNERRNRPLALDIILTLWDLLTNW